MRELVLGVVVDVLGHVRVEFAQRLGKRLVAAAARYFPVLNSAQLVVLLPQVGLENLRRGQEPQNRRVAVAEGALAECRSRGQPGRSQHTGAEHARTSTGNE